MGQVHNGDDLEARLVGIRSYAAAGDVPTAADVSAIVAKAGAEDLGCDEIAALVRCMATPEFPDIRDRVLERATELRRRLFGDKVVPMAPVEVSNRCASDCLFCGWRSSNADMDRVQISEDLVMEQVRYLIRKGIHYIELVGGDDFGFVQGSLPSLVRAIRRHAEDVGRCVKICFCTMSLTRRQYEELQGLGADSMIVWQETYDADCYARHIVGGPKSRGITDNWRVTDGGDGYAFRLHSQERALEAGLEVALGAILGLNDNLTFEILATVTHARFLMERYTIDAAHPLIIGMPTWNQITTPATDKRPAGKEPMDRYFSYIAAVYLLALPSVGTWVFPNCRVGMAQQIEAVRAAGVFTSTEVKLGPGGYLPGLLAEAEGAGVSTRALENLIAYEFGERFEDRAALIEAMDRKEQFLHDYHSHEAYLAAMSDAGLTVQSSPTLS